MKKRVFSIIKKKKEQNENQNNFIYISIACQWRTDCFSIKLQVIKVGSILKVLSTHGFNLHY